MSKRAFGSSLPILGYAFFVAALFLFIKGYQFNTDDQAEHLPQVYQLLEPQLYPSDYYVNDANSVFTVRFYYERFALLIAKTIGLEWGLFVSTFLSITLMAFSLGKIAERLFSNRWSVLLAPILALIIFYGFTIGGVSVMYASFISSTIAKGLSAFALWKFLEKKILISGLLLGIATLFQPLVGLQLFLVLTAYQVLVGRDFKKTTTLTLSYIALAAFILVPVFYIQFSAKLSVDVDWFYKVFYGFRNHLHYYPSIFPLKSFIKFGLLVVFGIASYAYVKPRDAKFYPAFIVINIFGLILYSVGLEVFDIYILGKTQWFKMTIWIEAFSAIMVAGLLGEFLSGISFPSILKKRIFLISSVSAMVLLIAITNSTYLPEKYQHKYMVGNRVVSDLEQIHIWISENTAKDAVVLTSPHDNGFSCVAKRSMPSHWQAIMHQSFFIVQWYEDFAEIYGVSLENLKGTDPRAHAVSLYATRNYRGTKKHIDYRLDNLETCQFTGEIGPIIHQEGDWILTEFLSE
jgi:hypothetical protein